MSEGRIYNISNTTSVTHFQSNLADKKKYRNTKNCVTFTTVEENVTDSGQYQGLVKQLTHLLK
jgi:hypothetical protein